MDHRLREKGCVDLRGKHPPLHQCHHATILQKQFFKKVICKNSFLKKSSVEVGTKRLKGLEETEREHEKGGSCNSLFILRLMLPRARPRATVPASNRRQA